MRAQSDPGPRRPIGAVGGVVDVVLHHGGVDRISASLHTVGGPGDLHDRSWSAWITVGPIATPQRPGLRIGHLGSADTGESRYTRLGRGPRDPIRIAPVRICFRNQQSQAPLRRGKHGLPRPGGLGMALHQRLVDS